MPFIQAGTGSGVDKASCEICGTDLVAVDLACLAVMKMGLV